MVKRLDDIELISVFENDPDEYVRDAVSEKLSEMSTQDYTDFSDALTELSNESLNLE